jgi:hypothetical protein
MKKSLSIFLILNVFLSVVALSQTTPGKVWSSVQINQNNSSLGLPASSFFGTSVASIGDFDGDGVEDFIVGAEGFNNTGAAWLVLMNEDLTVKSKTLLSAAIPLNDRDYFGSAVAYIGDLDGDGVKDIAIGARGDDTGGNSFGAIYVLFMNADGTVRTGKKISSASTGFAPGDFTPNGNFGTSLAYMGDNKLAVGANGYDDFKGSVWLLSLNNQGEILEKNRIASDEITDLSAFDAFGSSVAAGKDLDGDGTNDLVVGAPLNDAGAGSGTGAIYLIRMNEDLSIKSYTKIDSNHSLLSGKLSDYDQFGNAVCLVGDIDKSGFPDVVVGAYQADDENIASGAVFVLLMGEGGEAVQLQKISNTEGDPDFSIPQYSQFGSALAPMSDFNNNGVPGIAVGMQNFNATAQNQGGLVMIHLYGNARTGLVTDKLDSSVKAWASVHAHGIETEVIIEYGLTADYTHASAVTTIDATTDQQLDFELMSLTPVTTYHYRVKATNARGVTYGKDKTFTTESSFASGSGSIEDPYEISNLTELLALSLHNMYWDKHFIQTANINTRPDKELKQGDGFAPIGNQELCFSGSYNGDGYVVDGLTIDLPEDDYVGFFGCASNANIRSLGLTNVSISGRDYVGGLVGKVESSSVSDCFTTGSVNAVSYAGGLAGESQNTFIEGSYSACSTVASESYAGGLIGSHADGSEVINSYSTGTVSSILMFGGFIGSNEASHVGNCYSSGLVTRLSGSAESVGGFVGSDNEGSYIGNFWDMEASGQQTTGGAPGEFATGKTATDMRDIYTYYNAGWDFQCETENGTEDIWGINSEDNNGYPFLSWQGFASQSAGGVLAPSQSVCFNTAPDDLILSDHVGAVIVWEKALDESFSASEQIFNHTASILPGDMIGTLTRTSWFRVMIQCGSAEYAYSTTAVIHIDQLSAGGETGPAQTICFGTQAADISLVGHNGDVMGWEQATDAFFTFPQPVGTVTATTLSAYDIGTLTQTMYFRATVQSGSCTPEYSEPTEIIVRPAFIAGSIESAGETICYGGSAAGIYSIAEAGGGDQNIHYQWQSSTTSATEGFADIGTATTTFYIPPDGLTETTWFRRMAKDGECVSEFTAADGVWQLLVLPQFSAGAIATDGEFICYEGQPGTIGSALDASGGDEVISYQWQYSAVDPDDDLFEDSDFIMIPDATDASFTPAGNMTIDTWFRRLAQDAYCHPEWEVSEGVWMVSVYAPPVCFIEGETGTLCPSSSIQYSGPEGMSAYFWEITGDAGIVAGTASQTVSVEVHDVCSGTFTLTLTVMDVNACVSTCEVSVIVLDDEEPLITYCPDAIVVPNDPGQAYASHVSTGLPVATDNCSTPSIDGIRSDGQELDANYPIGVTTITWTIADDCGFEVSCTQTVTVIRRNQLQLAVFLQGPFNPGTGDMNTSLNAAGQLPAYQPYNRAPWYYGGQEVLPDPLPPEGVDWVLVELRSDTENMHAQRAGLLYNDGSVSVNFDDDILIKEGGVEAYYIVVYHRNHIPVMSNNPVSLPPEGASFDFTQAGNIYGGGAILLSSPLAPDIVGMIAGDVNSNGILKYSGKENDRSALLQTFLSEGGSLLGGIVPENGYWDADLNMDNRLVYAMDASASDSRMIIDNIRALTGSLWYTNIYRSMVPVSITSPVRKQGEPLYPVLMPARSYNR